VVLATLTAALAALALAPTSGSPWVALTGEWFDQARLVAAHQQRVREVGETWNAAWGFAREHMLWPEEGTVQALAVPPERTAGGRAECTRQLGVVLRPEYVPPGLEDHLVAISGYGVSGSDFLLTRYRAGRWRLQIIYSGHAIGILAIPAEPGGAGRAPTADYALQTAKVLFTPPRGQDARVLQARAISVDGIAHGSIRNPNAGPAGSLAGSSPWYSVRLITDGRYVWLSPAKWGLYDDTDIRTAGMPSHQVPLDKPVLLFEPEAPPR